MDYNIRKNFKVTPLQQIPPYLTFFPQKEGAEVGNILK